MTTHLTCYDVKPAHAPGHATVVAESDLGAADLRIEKRDTLCVPSVAVPSEPLPLQEARP